MSEATARAARYAFLERVKQDEGADAIITAHHQDDVLETMILNMLRGTGRKGLSSLRSTEKILRPLLSVPKAQLVQYAQENHLSWHEDSTNQDLEYTRNYIRHRVLSRFDDRVRNQLFSIYKSMCSCNDSLDSEIDALLSSMNATKTMLPRHHFIMLPHGFAREVLAMWLRNAGLAQFDRYMLERLVVAIKTFPPGKQTNVYGQSFLRINRENVTLTGLERWSNPWPGCILSVHG